MTSWPTTRTRTALAALALAILAWRPAAASVRLENICTIYGQQEVKLRGLGLVVGLNGTGDGGKNAVAMKALAAALRKLHNPATLDELKDTKNVAIVLVEATVPRTGLRRGQRLDCRVSSIQGAKSLRRGQLLVTPLQRIGDEQEPIAVALASGAVRISDADVPTNGLIPSGVVLQEDFLSHFVDRRRGHIVTLLLDAAHSSFHSAAEVARVVNDDIGFEVGIASRGTDVARATGPGVIEVQGPEQYHDAPVEFIANVLKVNVENPHTQARVVLNASTGTVAVTGEVEISPVIISHKNLTVRVGGGDPLAPEPSGPFVPVVDRQSDRSPQRLEQLVQALNQLRVPTEDVIDIIRTLHATGKLHAVLEEH